MRDKQIDLLRFLGISLIVLAHIGPPNWLFELRNFDVPLIVLVSGMSFIMTNSAESYFSYIWKRIKRLVFPLWIFLTIYFLIIGTMHLNFIVLNFRNIAGSFLLIKGIGGFLWIIRVFLLVAILSPLLFNINKSIKSNNAYLIFLLTLFIFYQLFTSITFPFLGGVIGEIIYYLFYFAVAYSLIFAIGIRLNQLTIYEAVSIGCFSLFIFVLLGFIYYLKQGHYVSTQEYKYPPYAYYLSYGVFASILAWYITKGYAKSKKVMHWIDNIIMFVAQNSLWIYLWHILCLNIVYKMPIKMFLLRYILVYSGAIFFTFAQVMSVKKWLLPSILNENTRKNFMLVLTG